MTNKELLQRAKDMVAKEAKLNEGVKYNTWEELMTAIFMEFHGEPIPFSFQIGLYYEKAIAKAIQSAREEGVNWIDCSYKMPSCFVPVLVWDSKSKCTRDATLVNGKYKGRGNRFVYYDVHGVTELPLESVSHWTPKPELKLTAPGR